MEHIFYYTEEPELKVEKVAVIGDFNGWANNDLLLEKTEDGKWVGKIELAPGDYGYQFLINDYLYLNDYEANLYAMNQDGKLVSYMRIDTDGKRLYNVQQYKMNIQEYYFTTSNGKEETRLKNTFIRKERETVVLHIVFNNVTGIHDITALWCHKDQKHKYYNDEILQMVESEKKIDLKFPLDEVIEGLWEVKIFINGKYLMKPNILILEGNQSERIRRLLPIGSVVLLEKSKKSLMIIGRFQRSSQGGTLYDYAGCYFPEGLISATHSLLFNHEQIEKILYKGFINNDENTFKENLIKILG